MLWYKAIIKVSSKRGRPAKDARLVIGAVIIKHKLGLSDRETVCQIQENPYLQYFIGLASYQMKVPFVPSLLVEVRKRMGDAVFEVFHPAEGLFCAQNKGNNKVNGEHLAMPIAINRHASWQLPNWGRPEYPNRFCEQTLSSSKP